MHSKKTSEILQELSVNETTGLSFNEIAPRRAKYGGNIITGAKQKTFLKRVLEAFCDPMMIILSFALSVTLGVNIGKLIKTGSGDFTECIGVFIAVFISVSITAVMEGKSEKAFELLRDLSDNTLVRVLREGELRLIPKSEVVVGDIVFLEAGNSVIADGRLLKTASLSVDESTLTGESKPKHKRADVILEKETPLAERINCLYSGTCVITGNGKMLVTNVGNNTEIGKIAGELQIKNKVSAPINEKLARLSKWITALGGISAAITFSISFIRLYLTNNISFSSVQELFIESIVLIVAAVPEGLPTIVAISLSLNVLKLAKENALIKKLVVAETAGCVSVICSDKTGTLTANKMMVDKFFLPSGIERTSLTPIVYANTIANSTAEEVETKGKKSLNGNPTEKALIAFAVKDTGTSITAARNRFIVEEREEFSSDKKYMSTKTHFNGQTVTFYKGAFEKILEICHYAEEVKKQASKASHYADNGGRIIAFAHKDSSNKMFYDGFVSITDPVRPDVKKSVTDCRNAGIRVMMLTGDGENTAFSVAKKIGIANIASDVKNAAEIEKMTDKELSYALNNISVIARSTPLTKLRVVKLLKRAGEVVAVTGDGVNDAPAIKQADIGIAMGSGSEIAKEAGDIVLLDDSFSTIVKAISFGRNVYRNFRRFITFQLSVNFSAVATVLFSLIAGIGSPFNSLQLLWINIIMDGPPALTLGIEKPESTLLGEKPKKRSDNLIDKKTALKIILSSSYITFACCMQLFTNFLNVKANAVPSSVFTLFVILQLFNSFNCRKTGTESVFVNPFGNKPMLIAFGVSTAIQFIITQFLGSIFQTSPLSSLAWIKIFVISFGVILVSECAKLFYRALFKRETTFFQSKKANQFS